MEPGSGVGMAKTMLTRRRSALTLTSGANTSRPSITTVPWRSVPSVRSERRLKRRSSVDLPARDGPKSTKTWLGTTSRLMLCSASVSSA